jgi:DNA-binding transcriptional LysR family regulator
VDLYQLKYFREVARELSFTRAAGNLRVSPSAVSRSVAQLEASVRKRLFSRTRRQVSLSTAGEALKARADRIFDEIERAEQELGGEDRALPVLRIGSRELITNYLLPGPLLDFQQRHDGTRFGLYALEPRALAEAIKKDQIDFGLSYAEASDPALESRLLGRLNSHVYASKKLARGGAAPAFVAPRAFGRDPSAPSADGYPDRRHPRRIRYEVEFLETHRRFVLSGLCAGVLPDIVMKKELERGEVVILPSPAIRREIHLLRRRGRTLPKAADLLIDGVRRTIRELTSRRRPRARR